MPLYVTTECGYDEFDIAEWPEGAQVIDQNPSTVRVCEVVERIEHGGQHTLVLYRSGHDQPDMLLLDLHPIVEITAVPPQGWRSAGPLDDGSGCVTCANGGDCDE